jgi:pimeloyl-ACP methyl ester carboxylesterase
VVEFLINLVAFIRLIIFDRRGSGASDGVSVNAMPTWEVWTEDILAVVGGAGSKRTAILAAGDAGPTAILFAAMVGALVLVNTSDRFAVADEYPIGASPEEIDAFVELIATEWGSPNLTRIISPSVSHDAEAVRLRSMVNRASATPRSAAASSATSCGVSMCARRCR